MTKYLITPTLLNAFRNINKYDDGFDSFYKILNKESFTHEHIERGNQVEEEVLNAVNDTSVAHKGYALEMAQYCKGYQYQQKLKYGVNIAGINYLLYGRCDFLGENKIIDIKYTKNYKVGKYINNFQHKFYMACLFANNASEHINFKYIITDLKEVYVEDYNYEPEMYSDIINEISAFSATLAIRPNDIGKIYQEKWKAF